MAPKKLVTLQPEGVVRFIFDVEVDIIQRISKTHEHLGPMMKPYSSFFGTLTDEGLIQIWGVGLFCRSVLSLQTGHSSSSWAAVRVIDDQITFLVYSRGFGLFVEVLSECSSSGIVKWTLIQYTPGANPGFSTPFCHGNNETKYIADEDSLIQVDPISRSLKRLKFLNITHITFFTAFERHINLVLVGSESGKLSLVDLSDQRPTILEEVDLLKSDTVQNAKRQCHETSDENMPIPLCCAGDEVSGHFLVGTRANVLVLVTLEISSAKISLRLVKAKGIPNPGVHRILLHPDKDKILVHGWDSKVRLFSFPGMDFLQSFEWPVHPNITAMSFLTVRDDSVSTFLILASDAPQAMTLRIFPEFGSNVAVY